MKNFKWIVLSFFFIFSCGSNQGNVQQPIQDNPTELIQEEIPTDRTLDEIETIILISELEIVKNKPNLGRLAQALDQKWTINCNQKCIFKKR
ncbi:MAG: hypothetical protein M9962_07560 [Oligoflexia bacterium]|nr:hypothetical protein [Oligoflexia bacterium]